MNAVMYVCFLKELKSSLHAELERVTYWWPRSASTLDKILYSAMDAEYRSSHARGHWPHLHKTYGKEPEKERLLCAGVYLISTGRTIFSLDSSTYRCSFADIMHKIWEQHKELTKWICISHSSWKVYSCAYIKCAPIIPQLPECPYSISRM